MQSANQAKKMNSNNNGNDDDDDELLDDDEINMSDLEDLMDEITLDEEIDDEISFKQIQ